jgi:hypothetical protein
MSNFKTSNGLFFTIDLKTKDVRTVKEMVNYPDGKPVDILEAAETGTIHGILGDIATFVDVMFVVCLDQIKQYFDLKKYDEDNRKTYDLFPEQQSDPPLTKASRWFGSIIDGNTLIAMMEAFNEAVINFTPSATKRIALQTILQQEKEIERIESEYRMKSVNRMFEKTKSGLEERWKKLTTQKEQELRSELDGHFNKSGDSPE